MNQDEQLVLPKKNATTITEHDSSSGLEYIIMCNNESGYYCGYIAIPEDHPLYGVSYKDLPGTGIVPGGWTYSADSIAEFKTTKPCWFIGFDCQKYKNTVYGSSDYTKIVICEAARFIAAWRPMRKRHDVSAIVSEMSAILLPNFDGFDIDILRKIAKRLDNAMYSLRKVKRRKLKQYANMEIRAIFKKYRNEYFRVTQEGKPIARLVQQLLSMKHSTEGQILLKAANTPGKFMIMCYLLWSSPQNRVSAAPPPATTPIVVDGHTFVDGGIPETIINN